jgi:hypothetical protein
MQGLTIKSQLPVQVKKLSKSRAPVCYALLHLRNSTAEQ